MSVSVFLPNEVRAQILARLSSESSDTKLSVEFGVSRKTIWRLRQPKAIKKVMASPESIAQVPPANDTEDLASPGYMEQVAKLATRMPQLPPEVNEPDPPTTDLTIEPVKRTDMVWVEEMAQREEEAGGFPGVTGALISRSKRREEEKRTNGEATAELATYFAIQLLRGENHKILAQDVLEAASKQGVLFRKLQALDTVTLGTMSLLRFRSDIPDAYPVVKRLKGRGIAYQDKGQYVVQFPNGKVGKFPTMTMCSAPKLGEGHIYVGTRIRRWRQQFEAA